MPNAELVNTAERVAERRVMTTSHERIRLSFLSEKCQVDVSLPRDVPLAYLTPAVVKLVTAHTAAKSDSHEGEGPTAEATNTVWVVSRNRRATSSTGRLAPDRTLRQAGISDGDLLYLHSEAALTSATLYDDAVDAAAQLTRSGYLSWDARIARWVALVGITLISAVWVYFLASDLFTIHRTALEIMSAIAVLLTTGAATVANRIHGHSNVGTVLGWSALPVAAALSWVTLSGLGLYGTAVACAAMAVASAVLYGIIGTGWWGYLCAIGAFVFAGLGAMLSALGVAGVIVGCGLALTCVVACHRVPWLTSRYLNRARSEIVPHAEAAESTMAPADIKPADSTSPSADSTPKSWQRARSLAHVRGAVYTCLAIGASLGIAVIAASGGPLRWSAFAFAMACAATMLAHALRQSTLIEYTPLLACACVVTFVCSLRSQISSEPMSLTALIIVLLAATGFTAAGTMSSHACLRATADYTAYLGGAALIPLALWVVNNYPNAVS